MTLGQDVTLWSMLPHTHVRGKRWSYEITYPDGRKDTILSVPKYDFNWQTDYVFKEPLKMPKGTKIHATAWYDNSTANKANPDPRRTCGGANQNLGRDDVHRADVQHRSTQDIHERGAAVTSRHRSVIPAASRSPSSFS